MFAALIAHLFNKSLAAGIVPTQWKTAIISPIPKVANPQQPSDFRPKLLKKADNLPLFFMVYLLHRLYGVDAPAYQRSASRQCYPACLSDLSCAITYPPCPVKTCDYIFYNNFNNKCPIITIVFGIVSSQSRRHRKMVPFPTSPI